MVECCSSTSMIVYGLSNCGMNFAMCCSPLAVYSLHWCRVEKWIVFAGPVRWIGKKDWNKTEPNCKRPDHRLRLHKFWIFLVASCNVCQKIKKPKKKNWYRPVATGLSSHHVLDLTYAHFSLLSVTRSSICFRSLKSPISALNIDTGFLGFFSELIITLTNMIIKFFCAKTESDEPRILKGGFQHIKTMVYANVFQDLIWSFALGYLKIYRHVLVNDATSNTKNWVERWSITLRIQWISILCLLSVASMIFRWLNVNTESWGQ